jgi:hypothetical protein
MMLFACQCCGGPIEEGESEFLDLRRPSVRIVGVPTLVCADCGAGQCPPAILARLDAIRGAAVEHALSRGLGEVGWTFTPGGPAEVGGMPGAVRESFGFLRLLVHEERCVQDACARVARERPAFFH